MDVIDYIDIVNYKITASNYIITHSNKYAAIIDDDSLNAVTSTVAIMPYCLASISAVSDDIVM